MEPSVRIPLPLVPYVPALLLLCCIIFMQTPLPLFPSALWPDIALICVFFWMVHYPQFLPAWLLFVMGILADAITGAPLGVTSCIWMLFSYVWVTPFASLIAKDSMVRQWMWMFLCTIPVWGGYWGLHSFVQETWMPHKGFLMSWLYTGLAYPPLYMAFSSIKRRFPRTMTRRAQFTTMNRDRG